MIRHADERACLATDMKKVIFDLTRVRIAGYFACGLSFMVVTAFGTDWAHAQTAASKPAAAASVTPVAIGAKNDSLQRSAAVTKPLWSQLSTVQRAALAPLAAQWDGLSGSQKRKWIALSKNHHELTIAEQALLHARMNDWVKLSPQQRRTARLNFAETKRLSADEKQQKWEAYKALSPDARLKLNESAPALPSGAAVAVRPAPTQKLATVPMTGPSPIARPRLTAPNQIDPHTLLPQRGGATGASGSPSGSTAVTP